VLDGISDPTDLGEPAFTTATLPRAQGLHASGDTAVAEVVQVPVAAISVPRWRAPIDAADRVYVALRVSVRSSGVLRPLLLRPCGDGFEVVSGLRRLRAAQDTAQASVPAVVQRLDDTDAVLAAWHALERDGVTGEGLDAVYAVLLAGGLSAEQATETVAPLRILAPAPADERLARMETAENRYRDPLT